MIRQAMILAAGLGTRLRPLTDERPKPLIEVLGRPLLGHALEHAKEAGCERVAINSHWLHPAIPEAFGERYAGMELVYSHEPEVLGTGGGLKKMSRLLDPEAGPFLVLNADALIDLDVEGLLAAHAAARAGPDPALATLVLKEVPDAARYGALGTDEQGRVRTFAGRTAYEGPVAQERMFCGVHVLEPAVLEWLTDAEPCCINQVGYPRILDEGHAVASFGHQGAFWDVGTPERLLGANLALLEGSARAEHLKVPAGLPGGVVTEGARVDDSARLEGPALIAPGAEIGPSAHLGPRVVVGPGVRVGAGARLSDLVVLSGVEVPEGAAFASGILGPGGLCAASPEPV